MEIGSIVIYQKRAWTVSQGVIGHKTIKMIGNDLKEIEMPDLHQLIIPGGSALEALRFLSEQIQSLQRSMRDLRSTAQIETAGFKIDP